MGIRIEQPEATVTGPEAFSPGQLIGYARRLDRARSTRTLATLASGKGYPDRPLPLRNPRPRFNRSPPSSTRF